MPTGEINHGLRDLVFAKIEALSVLLDERHRAIVVLIDERDRLYKERDDARRIVVDMAFLAIEKQTRSTFEASDRAIIKAENAQNEYNIRSNEFRGQLDDQAKLLMSRTESLNMFSNTDKAIEVLRAEIAGLREYRSAVSGQGVGTREAIAYVIAGVSVLATITSIVFQFVRTP